MTKLGLTTLVALAVCSASLADTTLPLPHQSVDIAPPTIEHEPSTRGITEGEAARISAKVVDVDTGIQSVSLFFRTKGATQYNRLPMESKAGSSEYIAEIPERYVQGNGVEYYIEAVDAAGNKILRGVNFSPLFIAIGQNTGATEDTAGATGDQAFPSPSEAMSSAEEDSNKKTWWYVAGGVVATGLVLAITSGGDKKDKDDTGSVTIKAPAP